MNRTEKTEMISEVRELLENSNAVYLADYTGINVEDISNLRNEFRNDSVRYKVYKNTLFKRALDESGKFQKLSDHLVGMTGYIFASGDNIVAPAKMSLRAWKRMWAGMGTASGMSVRKNSTPVSCGAGRMRF